jgi:hypothetical protein
MSPSELFDSIVAVAPPFQAVRREHLVDNDDQLLPHLLMSDLLRYLGSGITRGVDRAEIVAILNVLDEALASGNSETENAIAVSFVEHLEGEPFLAELDPLLGPHLKAERERQLGWDGYHVPAR